MAQAGSGAGWEDLLQGCNQRWQVAGDDLPEDIEIHGVVTVDESVPQADDLRPGDTGIAGALDLGHAAGGFADDFQQAHEGEVELAVGIEVGAGLAARHLHRLTGVVEHVPQPEIGIMARRSTPPPLPGPGHGSKG